MKKLAFYLIFLIPIIAKSGNPPPPGLDDPVAAPIDSMLFVLFTAAIVFGSYIIFKKK